MDIEPTAEVIDEMAETMRRFAESMSRTANKMRETGDLGYAAEALTDALACMNNMRMDLLVVRPLREFQRQEVNLKNLPIHKKVEK
jgi:hypothetical protein